MLHRVRACTARRYTPSVYRHFFILPPALACRRRPRRLAKGRLRPVPQPPADDEPTRCSSRLLQATASGGSRVPALSPPPIPSRAPNPASSPAKTKSTRALPHPQPATCYSQASSRRSWVPRLPLASSRRSSVRQDVHGRRSSEEERIDIGVLGCGGDGGSKPNPRSRCRGGGGGGSWCPLNNVRPWCWVSTTAPF
jgi:hypothetical protein